MSILSDVERLISEFERNNGGVPCRVKLSEYDFACLLAEVEPMCTKTISTEKGLLPVAMIRDVECIPVEGFVGHPQAVPMNKPSTVGTLTATRVGFDQVYLRLAQLMALRSTCRRLSVGAVITSVDHRYVFGVGYNGNAAGLRNGCDSDEPGACGCVHAEANAVVNCREDRAEPKRIYLTDSPCVACAKLIINLGGVEQVTYLREYRKTEGRDLLLEAGIGTTHDVGYSLPDLPELKVSR